MSTLDFPIPPKILEIIERNRINTSKKILQLSTSDIKKLTNLSLDDILLLKSIVAHHISPISTTADQLIHTDNFQKLSTCCVGLNNVLGGGLRKGTLTEIYGESGSGKTQLCLQISANTWSSGSIYICTESLFPTKRFNQLVTGISNYKLGIDYGKNIFVEHVTEAHELLACIKVCLPKLLENQKVSHIVIDSVAAPFRSEYNNYVQRAEELRELAVALINVAQKFQLAVICLNHVSANLEDNINIASLGLAWSNMVTTRLCLRKTAMYNCEENQLNSEEVYVRELSVDFSSDLPQTAFKFIIRPDGIHEIF